MAPSRLIKYLTGSVTIVYPCRYVAVNVRLYGCAGSCEGGGAGGVSFSQVGQGCLIVVIHGMSREALRLDTSSTEYPSTVQSAFINWAMPIPVGVV